MKLGGDRPDAIDSTSGQVHVSVPDVDGPRVGLYEAWVLVELRYGNAGESIEVLRAALQESLWLALGRIDCAHVDMAFEIINPYLSLRSKEELLERFGLRPGFEVHRLAVRVSDGRSEGLQHGGGTDRERN